MINFKNWATMGSGAALYQADMRVASSVRSTPRSIADSANMMEPSTHGATSVARGGWLIA